MIVKKLKASSPKYNTIKETIDVLQNNGFNLEAIRPKAEKETYNAEINYFFYSFEDFIEKSYDAFREHKKEVGDSANADWSRTTFALYNADIDMRINLFIDECNGNTDPCEGYLIIMDYKKDRDNLIVEKLFRLLTPFFV